MNTMGGNEEVAGGPVKKIDPRSMGVEVKEGQKVDTDTKGVRTIGDITIKEIVEKYNNKELKCENCQLDGVICNQGEHLVGLCDVIQGSEPDAIALAL
jgi:hypothetical protein